MYPRMSPTEVDLFGQVWHMCFGYSRPHSCIQLDECRASRQGRLRTSEDAYTAHKVPQGCALQLYGSSVIGKEWQTWFLGINRSYDLRILLNCILLLVIAFKLLPTGSHPLGQCWSRGLPI